jgi:hypothetical protein
MNTKKDGGPAFPCDLTAYDKEVRRENEGMALRDYFAAKAMQSYIAVFWEHHENIVEEQLAAAAYVMADAMIKIRKIT